MALKPAFAPEVLMSRGQGISPPDSVRPSTPVESRIDQLSNVTSVLHQQLASLESRLDIALAPAPPPEPDRLMIGLESALECRLMEIESSMDSARRKIVEILDRLQL